MKRTPGLGRALQLSLSFYSFCVPFHFAKNMSSGRGGSMQKQLNGRISKYLASPDSKGKDADSIVTHLKQSFPRDYARTKSVSSCKYNS